MPTKDELSKENEALREELEQVRAQAANQGAAMVSNNVEGWLITTPNPSYSEKTAGIQFRGGMAFIPATIKDAIRIVSTLVDDFGYSMEETTAGRFRELDVPIEEPKETTLEKLMREPARYGG